MGDGQDRQDAEGVTAPGGQPPAEPIAVAPESPATEGPAPEAQFPDDASLTGAIASLESPEPPSADSASVVAAAKPAEVAEVPGTPDSQGVEADIAALQDDLETAVETDAAETAPAAADTSGTGTEAVAEPAESLDDIAPGTVSGEAAARDDAGDIGLADDRRGCAHLALRGLLRRMGRLRRAARMAIHADSRRDAPVRARDLWA